MAQDNSPQPNSLMSLFRRLVGVFQPEAAAPGAPAPDLVITDENRADLLHLAQHAPFAYGYWSQVKKLYKVAEAGQHLDILSVLIARLDVTPFAAKPTPLATPLSQSSASNVQKIRVVGTNAFLLTQTGQAGLQIVDVSDPVQPRQIGFVSINNPVGLAVGGERAYVLEGSNYTGQTGGLHIMDISRPESPAKLGTSPVQYANGLALMGKYAVVTSNNYRNSNLTVFDVSDPNNILTVSTVKIDAPSALAVNGQTVFVLAGEQYRNRQKLIVFDLANPIQPRQIASLDMPGANGLTTDGKYLYVALGRNSYYAAQPTDGLAVYRLDNPGARIGFLAVGNAQNVVAQGRYAYVAVEGQGYSNPKEGGLRIVDVADPLNPRLAGQLPGGGVKDMAVSDAMQTLFFNTPAQRYGPSVLRAADIRRPETPYLLGVMPSNKTFGYMKRRARRALRRLADADPAQYVYIATQILTATGKGRDTLDARVQWVCMDILYGGSRRYEQAGHGRGAYLLRGTGLSLRTREEAYPYLWDRHPLLAESLYTLAELPWQTHETACKMLRGMRRTLPDLPDATLLKFLQSPSPLLAAVATRALAARLAASQSVAPDLAAETFFKGSGRSRKAVRDYIARQSNLNSKWTNPFAARLYALASANIAAASSADDNNGESNSAEQNGSESVNAANNARLSRRQSLAFAYLVAAFPHVLSRQAAPGLAVLLYATRRPELVDWTLATLRQALAGQTDIWLRALEPLSDDLRAPALAALTESLQTKPLSVAMMRGLVSAPSAWIRATAWDLIAASPTPDSDLAAVWDDLLAATAETDALRSAAASPAAIALFNRLSLDGSRLQSLLETRPFLVGLLPPDALQNILRVLPVPAILRLIRAATDAQWPTLRGLVVNALGQAGQIGAFWKLAWTQIADTGDGVLVARLLDDEVVSASFMQADDADYLNTANPVFGPILARWIQAHDSLFTANSPALLQIATHMLPDIRAWGLERVRQVGMELPFALRLLESELLPAVAVGKTFFENAPAGDAREMEAATALCDSPKASVRAYGREYLEARWERLPHEELFDRLSENPDTQMEAFLAGKMLKTKTNFALAGAFDRQVLRGRDKGRRAKELVKQRLDTEPSQDVSLLLEMARSRSSRDAEWALGQLARLALDGVEIAGLEVERAVS